MTRASLIAHPELIVATALAGLMFGLLYFAILKRSVALIVDDKGWFKPLALTLGRIAAVVVLLLPAAKLGAAPLLAAFIGFLLARVLALHAERRAG